MAYKIRIAKCLNCGRLYSQAYPSKKYCDRGCYYMGRFPNRRINTICQNCNKNFWYYASRGNVKYCSHKCYTSTPKTDDFRRKISEAFRGANHPNWKGGVMKGRKDRNLSVYKEWRLAVFARDRYTCQHCGVKNHKGLGKTVILEADHIQSWTDYPELRYELSNGRTLCRDCHSKRTAEQHRERMSYVK